MMVTVVMPMSLMLMRPLLLQLMLLLLMKEGFCSR